MASTLLGYKGVDKFVKQYASMNENERAIHKFQLGLGDSRNSTMATDNVQWTLFFDPPSPLSYNNVILTLRVHI